jgi:hypothetical protein
MCKIIHQFLSKVPLLLMLYFHKDFFCTFAETKRYNLMTAQYQKTSSQIIDLMQQNAIKKYCFSEMRT